MSIDSFTGALASRYAKALYVVAEDKGKVSEFLEEVKTVSKSLESMEYGEKLFKRFSLMPKDGEQLVNVLADELGLRAEVKNFLKVILWNHRFSEILDICKSFANLCDEVKGRVFHVTFAKDFPEDKKRDLRDSLREVNDEDLNVKIVEDQDDSLIGGFQVRHKSKLMDYSVKSKLSRLRAALKGKA